MAEHDTAAERSLRFTPTMQDDVGQRLRTERERLGVSLRELARRVGISASAISQIETGRSRPSVSTLYSIVSELGMSLDELFAARPIAAAVDTTPVAEDQRSAVATPPVANGITAPVQREGSRQILDLESGVRWERLTPTAEADVDFLYVTYDVGGASSRPGTFMRHSGREYGLVLSGRLKVTIGFDEHELGPGDSIAFDSPDPHRLETIGDEPVKAVWFVIGRRQSDTRLASADGDHGDA